MARDDDSGLLGIDRRSLLQGLGVAGLAATVGGASSASAAQDGADRRGPYRKNRFLVEIDDLAIAGFSEVDLPSETVEDVEYRDGNGPPGERKLWGGEDREPLVLQRGVTDDSIALYEWFRQAQAGKLEEARRSVAVVVLDETGNSGPRWEFRDAWPARYEGPELDATEEGVAIETLEVLHEGMERTA